MSATFDIQQTVRHMVRRLVERYQPERVVLFGSAAYGEPDEDSDIDILIIKETAQSPLERRVQVRRLLYDPQRRTPFSPLVLTPSELERRLAMGDPFYREILHRGKVLYARA
ncbi:MAG TPA: nucleotidyltransferase domain-containing protein [Anaerolineae bacterium]|nr:nucleotidyltransferase domain-containing protein [Anaerolineae bacterium]HOQ97813.1 nucleotidyltransferase domain-containing protein [Anaerolineae bacterium]HPL29557.1 nucleotidyltransferase domain-containing protein [Anaerolineae bacterium]